MWPERRRPGRPSLASIQAAAMSLITGRDAGLDAPAAGALIVGDSRASADERMHVYAHMYRARIVEALESQFPRLARLLGAGELAALSAAYISDEPSRHPSLRYLGQRLPAWLEVRRPASPELVGLARLEWARADVFDVVDEPALTLDALQSWPMDRFGELPLQLITAHRLITVPAATPQLWDALDGEVAGRTEAVPADAGSQSLVVWRQGTVVYHRSVDEQQRAALELVSRGTRFGVLCESLLAALGEEAEEAAVGQAYAWMSTWLADGLLRVTP